MLTVRGKEEKKIDRHTDHEHGAGAWTYIFMALFWHQSSSKHRCLFRLVSPNLNLFVFVFVLFAVTSCVKNPDDLML